MLRRLRDRRLRMARLPSHTPRLRWSTSAPDTASTSRGSSPAQSWVRWPGGSADITVSLSKCRDSTKKVTLIDKTRENAAKICSKHELLEGKIKKMHIYLFTQIKECEDDMRPIYLGAVCCEKTNSDNQINFGTFDWCSFSRNV